MDSYRHYRRQLKLQAIAEGSPFEHERRSARAMLRRCGIIAKPEGYDDAGVIDFNAAFRDDFLDTVIKIKPKKRSCDATD